MRNFICKVTIIDVKKYLQMWTLYQQNIFVWLVCSFEASDMENSGLKLREESGVIEYSIILFTARLWLGFTLRELCIIRSDAPHRRQLKMFYICELCYVNVLLSSIFICFCIYLFEYLMCWTISFCLKFFVTCNVSCGLVITLSVSLLFSLSTFLLVKNHVVCCNKSFFFFAFPSMC